MRIRSVKPEFWRSSDVAKLTRAERLLWIGLWQYVDDNGVGRDILATIAGDLFPHDVENEGPAAFAWLRDALVSLAQHGRITRYEVDGERYLIINGWEHQRVDKPGKPRYPYPDGTIRPFAEYAASSRGPRDTLATPSRGSLPTSTTSHTTPETTPAALGASSHAPEAAAESGPAASVEKAALTGHSVHPRATVAEPSRESRETLAPVTGEQGNRGTGDSSSSNAADAAPDGDEEPIEVSAEARTFCDLLLALMAKNGERPRPAKVTNAWLVAADRMFRIDGRDGAVALGLLRWAKQDDFWAPNVQSPAKFRQQWEKIARDSKRAVKGQPRERHLSIVEELRAEEQRSIGGRS